MTLHKPAFHPHWISQWGGCHTTPAQWQASSHKIKDIAQILIIQSGERSGDQKKPPVLMFRKGRRANPVIKASWESNPSDRRRQEWKQLLDFYARRKQTIVSAQSLLLGNCSLFSPQLYLTEHHRSFIMPEWWRANVVSRQIFIFRRDLVFVALFLRATSTSSKSDNFNERAFVNHHTGLEGCTLTFPVSI